MKKILFSSLLLMFLAGCDSQPRDSAPVVQSMRVYSKTCHKTVVKHWCQWRKDGRQHCWTEKRRFKIC